MRFVPRAVAPLLASAALLAAALAAALAACQSSPPAMTGAPPPPLEDPNAGSASTQIAPPECPPAQQPAATEALEDRVARMIHEGRAAFRTETFGDEAFWSGKLRLHQAIAGSGNGGVGAGLGPRRALALGIKIDATALSEDLIEQIRGGRADLDSPAAMLALLRARAVIGLRGTFKDQEQLALSAIGVTCALCHSAVDDSVAPGIGRPLDGWPNRDLDMGKLLQIAPTLKPLVDLLAMDESAVRAALDAWGPGKYDAALNLDAHATRTDGRTGATVIPALFGLAGVDLLGTTGTGSLAYMGAFMATSQMYAAGTFFDPRLHDFTRFPVVERSGADNRRPEQDLLTARLPALHFYQLSLGAPEPPANSFDKAAADRGRMVFEGNAKCATCHVPPLYTEPGWAMHTSAEMGLDDFQATRSPNVRYYRTTPLKGLFTRARPGYYHDGRFADLRAVVASYERLLKLTLTDAERNDLIEFLRSL
jgi:hypothetical protein